MISSRGRTNDIIYVQVAVQAAQAGIPRRPQPREDRAVLDALRHRIGFARGMRHVTNKPCPVVLTPDEETLVAALALWRGDDRLASVPFYDTCGRCLYWEGTRLKQLAANASTQRLVLEAFEEDGWPGRIDDPLPPKRSLLPAARLRETVRNLNRGLRPGTIRFHSDGTGTGICWQPTG